MPTIELAVTQRVSNAIAQGTGSRQLALKNPSDDIAGQIRSATNQRRCTLVLGGRVRLTINDGGAIWPSAQEGQSIDDFNRLFETLAAQPDQAMQFLCEIED